MPSTVTPTLLLIAGVFGAFWCLNGVLCGDLAWEKAVIWFAIASVVAALGAQELLATDLHESDERCGF